MNVISCKKLPGGPRRRRAWLIPLLAAAAVSVQAAPADTARARHYSTHAAVTPANFDDGGPLSRAVHLAMTEHLPHAVIHRAGKITPLPERGLPALAGLMVDSALGRMSVAAYVENNPLLDALIVVDRGSVVFERYTQMAPTDKHMIWSVAKTLASAAVMLLEQERRIDLSAPVTRYLPELAATPWQQTAVRNVLHMASGMDCPETPASYSDPATCYYQFEASLDLLPRTAATPATPFAHLAKLRRDETAGAVHRYTSIDTFVVQWLVEVASGQPYARFLSERIWQRLGADGDAYVGVSAIGAPLGHGVVSATLRDVARWGLTHTATGRTRIGGILPATYTSRIAEADTAAAFAAGGGAAAWAARLGGEAPSHAAFQWDFVMPDGDMFKAGFGGQGLYVSPGQDLVIAWFGTHDTTGKENDAVTVARQIAKSGVFRPKPRVAPAPATSPAG